MIHIPANIVDGSGSDGLLEIQLTVAIVASLVLLRSIWINLCDRVFCSSEWLLQVNCDWTQIRDFWRGLHHQLETPSSADMYTNDQLSLKWSVFKYTVFRIELSQSNHRSAGTARILRDSRYTRAKLCWSVELDCLTTEILLGEVQANEMAQENGDEIRLKCAYNGWVGLSYFI